MKTSPSLNVHYEPGRSVRERLVLFILEKLAPLHHTLCRKRKAWGLNSDQLIRFPKGTLGHTLGIFYKKQKFEPVPLAERHDVFHVLLGYSTQVKEEAAMQFFLLGNGKWSLFTVGTAIISASLFPLSMNYFMREYRRGKSATPIGNWNFKELLNTKTTDLIQLIFKTKKNENS